MQRQVENENESADKLAAWQETMYVLQNLPVTLGFTPCVALPGGIQFSSSKNITVTAAVGEVKTVKANTYTFYTIWKGVMTDQEIPNSIEWSSDAPRHE